MFFLFCLLVRSAAIDSLWVIKVCQRMAYENITTNAHCVPALLGAGSTGWKKPLLLKSSWIVGAVALHNVIKRVLIKNCQ